MIQTIVTKPMGNTKVAQWDGTNDNEIHTFLNSGITRGIEVTNNGDSTLTMHFPSPYPDKYPEMARTTTMGVGAWTTIGGSVYTGEELNRQYYPYPEYPPVDSNAPASAEPWVPPSNY